VCGHATTNAITYTMTAPPDRIGAPAEVTETTHIIVVGNRDEANIGGITTVIVEVTKVT